MSLDTRKKFIKHLIWSTLTCGLETLTLGKLERNYNEAGGGGDEDLRNTADKKSD